MMLSLSPASRRGKRARRMHPNEPSRRRRSGVATADPDAQRFRVPPSQAGSKRVFLTCHYCGYSPPRVPTAGACPKCGGYSWERYAISTRLLPKSQQ